ncbi:MAG: Cof-type HAD-IIB family hydrolase [Bacillota bacterium]|nr:Cof-type HAD-IIB family hydrolase [Bacillota bacterium]
MKYKFIAVDMDGTLLNSQGKITEKNAEAIKKAVEKGVLFSICTGRPIQGVLKYNDVLNLDSPFTTYNGAMVVMGKSGKILYEQCLSASDAKKVLTWGREFDTTIIAWSQNRLYVSKLNERAYKYSELSNMEAILMENEEKLIKDGVTKIIWIDDASRMESYQSFLRSRLEGGVTFCTSQPTFLEFFDSGVSKGAAMEKIGAIFGIKREETIAIGDNYNDLSMIEHAGLGIAMGNSPEEIKKKAGFVTLSNDEDGVAYAIEKFIL